jgi:hypothetical protein
MSERIEALDIVGLSLLAKQAEGTRGHAKAVKACNEAKKIWREQRWNPKCPHCGKPLKK